MITLKHSQSQITKKVPVGFSWTTFFFGGFVALYRGQWGEVLKWIFLNPLTLGIWGFVQCWHINKKNIISFMEKGYVPATSFDQQILIEKGILDSSNTKTV